MTNYIFTVLQNPELGDISVVADKSDATIVRVSFGNTPDIPAVRDEHPVLVEAKKTIGRVF